MNKNEFLLKIIKNKYANQRELANSLNLSLGKVNKLINEFQNENYLNDDYSITSKTNKLLKENQPNKAIILAAGQGFRMIPINREMNKALIDVKGEVLIERLIKQLHEANITDITIVVGYMKETFEYLIDKFNVKLVVNKEYSTSNNLHSLYHVKNNLENCYIIPCDLYFKNNPFSEYELYSWYMVSNKETTNTKLKISARKDHFVMTKNEELGNRMIGLAYLCPKEAQILKENIEKLYNDKNYENSFWEEAIYTKNNVLLTPKLIDENDYVEFNDCNDLQQFDYESNCLNLEIFNIICESLNIKKSEIENITRLKAGMTNNSFLFETHGAKYIMRIPGEGTDQLINRQEEGAVYQAIKSLDICDPIIYFNKQNGYKLTQFINGAHNCDANNIEEVKKCMAFLRKFHESKLKVNHEFNIFDKIDFYETLWNNKPSMYSDYEETKQNIKELKKFIDSLEKEYTLTHIDAVPDNFLIYDNNGKEDIRLIDWEYAAMQDPHVDIAMYAIYALYTKEQVDQLIDLYFIEGCNQLTRLKIYAYIACCGLLWSNWCEYKHHLGIEFGEYSLAQYRYAKEFYKIVKAELGEKLNEF